MKTKLLILTSIMIVGSILISCKNEKKTVAVNTADTIAVKQEWAIVIHGGAGVITREKMTPEMDKEYRTALMEAMEYRPKNIGCRGYCPRSG